MNMLIYPESTGELELSCVVQRIQWMSSFEFMETKRFQGSIVTVLVPERAAVGSL